MSLLKATLSNRFCKFLCLKSLKGRGSKTRLPSFISVFPQHWDIFPVPTTYGSGNELPKLPGHYFGMQLKTNMQPMTSATTSKSELSFVLYLYSCLRQHGNALPGSVRHLLGLKVSSRALLQALKDSKQEHAIKRLGTGDRGDSKNSWLMLVLHPPGPKPAEPHRQSLMG